MGGCSLRSSCFSIASGTCPATTWRTRQRHLGRVRAQGLRRAGRSGAVRRAPLTVDLDELRDGGIQVDHLIVILDLCSRRPRPLGRLAQA
eukprot:4895898-Prymnesium_polylepis.1